MGRADPRRPSLPRKPRAPPSPTHPRPHLARRTGLTRVVGCGTDGRDAGAGHAGVAERAETEFFFFLWRGCTGGERESAPSGRGLFQPPPLPFSSRGRPFLCPDAPPRGPACVSPHRARLVLFWRAKGERWVDTHKKGRGHSLNLAPPFFFLSHTPHTKQSHAARGRSGKGRAPALILKKRTHTHTRTPPTPHHSHPITPKRGFHKKRQGTRSLARLRAALTRPTRPPS